MTTETSSQEGQQHGRYYPEYVQIASETEIHQQLQGVLDAAEMKEWRLVGVAGGLPNNGMILFWDTTRPSYGRRDYR